MKSEISVLITIVITLIVFSGPVSSEARADSLLSFPPKPVDSRLLSFQKSVEALHKKAVGSRKPWTEEALRGKVSSRYLRLGESYRKIKDPSTRAAVLAQLALIYAELAWVEKIAPIEKEVKSLDEDLARRLGHFEESEHFFVRVVGTQSRWAGAALKLGEAALAGYRDLFGFPTVSKVPGKKIRILIRVDDSLKNSRLYFHPTPLYHSELRYEMPDERFLTLAGRRRIVYGFCHELGHMVAMWGKYPSVEDDKHAWAHYTGCLVVEKVYDRLGNEPWPGWTSFQRRSSGKARLEKEIEGKTSGTGTYESILKLFHTIGEEFGTDVYGKAWIYLGKKKKFRRINNVPYLWLKDLKEALVNVVERDRRRRILEIFGP